MEAAETLFVPVVIYNNTSGDKDAATLKSFRERAWNNPVARFMTHDRKDLIPRQANTWTVGGITSAMVQALEKAKRPVPTWLRLLASERTARRRGIERAAFGMT